MPNGLCGGDLSPDALEALNIEMTRLLEGPGLTPAPPSLHGN